MVKVKICGITNLDDALAAIEYGADALGFIFAPSPRQVDPSEVKKIVSELPPLVTKVGVFVDAEIGKVQDMMKIAGLDLAQLHGTEGPEVCDELFPRVIKAFTPDTLPRLDELNQYPVTSFLLDKKKGSDTSPEQLWPIAREMASHGLVILAGALTPENVTAAISIAHPYAVDVSSGVEVEPGKKDHPKMKDFIRAAKREGSN